MPIEDVSNSAGELRASWSRHVDRVGRKKPTLPVSARGYGRQIIDSSDEGDRRGEWHDACWTLAVRNGSGITFVEGHVLSTSGPSQAAKEILSYFMRNP